MDINDGWSQEGQLSRFGVITDTFGICSGDSILDLGCGHAALLPFLLQRVGHIKYTGIDIDAEKIKWAEHEARARGCGYPPDWVKFRSGDVLVDSMEPADWVVANGVVSVKNSRNTSDMFKLVGKVWELCEQGAVVTVLRWPPDKTKANSEMNRFDPALIAWMLPEDCHFWKIDASYRDNDFALFMFRSQR